MKALCALTSGVSRLLRALVLLPVLAMTIAFFLVLGLLVGAGLAALIGFLVAAGITLAGTVYAVEALKR